MSKGFTIFLGAVEVAGGLGVVLGGLTQLASLDLILALLGAIQKKIFVRRTDFWGKSGAIRMELRHDAADNEPCDRHQRGWKHFFVEMIFCSKTRTTGSEPVCRCCPEVSRLCFAAQ